MNLTPEDVQDMVRLLEASDFDELQVETDRVKLTLRRAPNGGWTQERQTLGQPRLASGVRPQGLLPLQPPSSAVTAGVDAAPRPAKP